MTRVSLLYFILICCAPLEAATYYVHFDEGDDFYNGQSPASAWKHSPGDPNATGIPSGTILSPGDTVLFRGGVVYRGSVSVTSSGSPGFPIVYSGNAWGPEKARIEGADPISPTWSPCPSQAFAKGNPYYANIYYTDSPPGFPSFLTGIFEDGDFLWYSQGPDLADPFYYDNISEYYPIPKGSTAIRQTRTTLTDATRLTQTESDFWSGAHIATWIQGNLVAVKAITGFSPSSNTVTHEDLGAAPYTDRPSYYSLLNHVSLISRPGEYAYDSTQNRLYVWPRSSGDAGSHLYSVQVRDTAFTLSSASHVVIEGFDIRHFAQGVAASSTSATGVIVRNNSVSRLRSANKYSIFINASNSIIEDNEIVNCMRSVGILSSATGLTVSGNFVSRTSRQGIWFMGAKRSIIANNTVTDIKGSHSNAISIYSGSSDILVANNVVSEATLPLTFEDSSDLTFYGNLIDGGDKSRPVSEWFGMSGRVGFINNTFARNPDSVFLYVVSPGSAQYVFVNNILDGGGPASIQHEHNIFVGSPGWSLSSTESAYSSITDIFASPPEPDWSPKSGGPAVDSGANPVLYLPVTDFPDFDFLIDRNGTSRGSGGSWDTGYLEFSSGASVPVAPTGLVVQ
ncbi:MAG: right-handed parallel beta-helix repeat-containing protein [Opitutaceae bacterium]